MTPDPDGGLREQIREHATRLFAQRGFAGTSMRELTDACQCTKAACYYYFSSKEALYRDVVEYHSNRINLLVHATVSGEGTIRDRLHAGLDSMIQYAMSEPLAMRLIQRIELSPEDTAPVLENRVTREAHLHNICELVSVGAQTGEIRSDIEALHGALVLAGAMHYQFDNAIASNIWDSERMHKTIDLVLDGIANHE